MSKIICKNCQTKSEIVSFGFRCMGCGERICTECGCTDNAACAPACYWSKPGVCSTCHFSAQTVFDPLDASIIVEDTAEDEILTNEFIDQSASDATAIVFAIDDLERTSFYFPLEWRNESSGRLGRAVKSYLAHVSKGAPPPTIDEVNLIHRYLRAFIFAPVWSDVAVEAGERGRHGFTEYLGELRRLADKEFKSCSDIGSFLIRCLTIGLEPF
ncbi:MAG: hypothetical protein M3209_09670 [Acidobacteriota bacterium]|nr:hypothetical protein [Acidobacteriota bacterium]